MGTEVLGLFGVHKLRLARGAHAKRGDGSELCVMEAVAWFNNEPHSDHPECVDPVLGAYARPLNDRLSDDERQGLVNLIPRLAGSKGTADLGRRRAYLLVDRAVRQVLPLVYDEKWPEHAKALRALAEVKDAPTACAARDACSAAFAAFAASAYYAAASYAASAASASYAADAAAYAGSRAQRVALAIAALSDAIDLR